MRLALYDHGTAIRQCQLQTTGLHMDETTQNHLRFCW
jgi:hypothetical protein